MPFPDSVIVRKFTVDRPREGDRDGKVVSRSLGPESLACVYIYCSVDGGEDRRIYQIRDETNMREAEGCCIE